MADSKKSTVVIASVLKPVDDSRMYEKIGLTLAGSGRYDVHVIGCDSARIKKCIYNAASLPSLQQNKPAPVLRTVENLFNRAQGQPRHLHDCNP